VSQAQVAEIGAIAVLALNGAAGAFAALRWWQVQPSAAAWPLLRAGQVAAGLQALLAGVLFAAGYRPDDELFWLYALLPVAIGVIAEQLRIVSAEQVLENRGLPDAQAVGELPDAEQRSVVLSVVRREIGVMALAALVVAFLALRAALIV
jgi:hypothetical protein